MNLCFLAPKARVLTKLDHPPLQTDIFLYNLKLHLNKKYRINYGEYQAIYKPYFKYRYKSGYIKEHRYIYHIYLSIKYNRIIYLPKSYDVHHINENPRDNRIQNLELISKAKHKSIHNPIKDRSNTFCNLCKSKTTRIHLNKNGKYYVDWFNDINGFLCYECYITIRRHQKRFSLIK